MRENHRVTLRNDHINSCCRMCMVDITDSTGTPSSNVYDSYRNSSSCACTVIVIVNSVGSASAICSSDTIEGNQPEFATVIKKKKEMKQKHIQAAIIQRKRILCLLRNL